MLITPNDIQQLLTWSIVVVPIVVGLTEVVKRLGLPSKFSPLVSIGFGLVIALLMQGVSTLTVLAGIIYGLSAAGLYSGTKALASQTSTPPPSPDQP